jgi:hypothetical protein
MEIGDIVEKKEIEDDGWNEIDSFAKDLLIFLRGNERIVWCKRSKEIILKYEATRQMRIIFIDEFSDE